MGTDGTNQKRYSRLQRLPQVGSGDCSVDGQHREILWCSFRPQQYSRESPVSNQSKCQRSVSINFVRSCLHLGRGKNWPFLLIAAKLLLCSSVQYSHNFIILNVLSSCLFDLDDLHQWISTEYLCSWLHWISPETQCFYCWWWLQIRTDQAQVSPGRFSCQRRN